MAKYKVIWTPQPKQAEALTCPAQELFYGGAAGGGKSDFLLNDFLQGAQRWGKWWFGILFRQTTSQLEELQKRAKELFVPMGAIYRGPGSKDGHNTWFFPNGATLKMRYLESEKDVEQYQGHQYTWIGFDELGNYPSDYCWVFMGSRLRSPYGVPCYQRGTANPGGVGHGWIKHRFMDGKEPNKIFTIEKRSESGKLFKVSAVFIPSRLEDNQVLMNADPDYEARLMNLPPHLARAMRYGDWSVFAGQVFCEFTTDVHVIKPFALEPGIWFKFCAMDWGYKKPFSIGWYAVNSDGRVIRYREWYGCRENEPNVGIEMGSKDVAEKAWELSIAEGVVDMVADPAIWNTQDDVIAVKDNFEKVGWKMHKANNDRVNGLITVHDYLKTVADENGNRMFSIFPSCYGFIRTIPMLTPNPHRPEDVNTDLEDHVYDEVRYALMSDFVKFPGRALRKQNGSWRVEQQEVDYNPYDNI